MDCPRLIEVALPIREISAESVRDKSLRHGHVSTLHLWWARRPLAACRAVIFASLVPDPDDENCPPEFRNSVIRMLKTDVPSVLQLYRNGRNLVPDPDPYRPYDGRPDSPRNRLLTFIAKWSPQWILWERGKIASQPKPSNMLDERSLVKWEASAPDSEQGHEILNIARELIRVANDGNIPTVFDPFAGGGAIPLEAGRLGCQPIANDYNPVAYLILRATCEFPQKYAKPGRRKILVEELGRKTEREVQVRNVLLHDFEKWTKWILERAREKIGHLYPPGKDGKPIVGYLWARTAPCSNPSCRAGIPMLKSLLICNKPEKKVALTLTMENGQVKFDIARDREIKATDGMMLRGGDCRCPYCHQISPVEDLRSEGLNGQLGEIMVAVITDTPTGKAYRPIELADLTVFETASKMAKALERPSEYIVPEINAPGAPSDAGCHRSISIDLYGFKTFGSIFNDRQLLAMNTFTDCLRDALVEVQKANLEKGYREALAVYLGLWLSRCSTRMASMCRWDTTRETLQAPFDAQAFPIKWDYPEANPFSESTGGFGNQIEWIQQYLGREPASLSPHNVSAEVYQGDAANVAIGSNLADIAVTDPPYFDSIAYADLSDFFYVWLKRGLADTFPEVFSTPQTPKSDECVAHKHRHHGNRTKGKEFFELKLADCFTEMGRVCKDDGLISVMFAHQSTEAWAALINALFKAGMNVTATYPIDTELKNRIVALGVASLESSITVTCRPRQVGSAASFRDIRKEIEQEVRRSMQKFWDYGFRGADLIVACYGPAVGVFGRYERVERADGTLVTVPELLEIAKESALKAIAGEFTGDALSRLYFVWTNLYGITEQAWDDARLVVQIGGESEDAMEVAKRRELFIVDGSTCRLALLRDREDRRNLGDSDESPLIDKLHRAMKLWKDERRAELTRFLAERDLEDSTRFWKLAQALFEVLPRGEEDWKIISALLSERDTLRIEALRKKTPVQLRTH